MRPHAQYTKRYDFLLRLRLRRRKAGHFRFDPLNGGGADAAKLGSF
jgi:hypothetical protein